MEPEEKIIYYKDLLNDEFSGAEITARSIDGNYRYIYTQKYKRFTHFFWYRIVATPLAYIYLKIKFRYKIINKQVLKTIGKKGCFLYGNHTHPMMDAFMPSMISFPKDAYVVVHADNVSMPVLAKITPSLGALPLPDDSKAARNFLKAVETRIQQNHCLFIYPEAHIWPYYTKIRPFTDLSFRYPVKCQSPVFCFTNTYQKRKLGKKPKVVTYIDGPFYPDVTLSNKEQKEKLRNQVYEAMVQRSQNSNVEMIKYIPSGEHVN